LHIATPDGAIDRIRRGHLKFVPEWATISGDFSEEVSFAMRLRRMFASAEFRGSWSSLKEGEWVR
jgi:hypothetical protein